MRRQYAQALIELKDFDRAATVLTRLIEETSGGEDPERFEARGLMGRLLKQRYIDARDRREPRSLTQAIETYWAVFREDAQNVWHGINAASCILRADRDGIEAPPTAKRAAIAKRILDVLQTRQKNAEAEGHRLDVWDYATRVEALIDLGAFDAASKALDDYITHPDMDAFEVSSTYRQFDEVLQLGSDARGRPLLDRLQRPRNGCAAAALSAIDDQGTRPMLVRVSDPEWKAPVFRIW